MDHIRFQRAYLSPQPEWPLSRRVASISIVDVPTGPLYAKCKFGHSKCYKFELVHDGDQADNYDDDDDDDDDDEDEEGGSDDAPGDEDGGDGGGAEADAAATSTTEPPPKKAFWPKPG
jgi:hypothetical protein